MIKFKYKGRSFSSAESLAKSLQKELKMTYEAHIRRAALSGGLSVRKTAQGLEISGESGKMGRFQSRLGR